ncbi:MAG: class I SAM-dependent methyltransferase [Planctomycetes bacterium]|nr:class I SAM-dependent methyltransferase [Planctomycetota bacterium]
MPDANRDIYDRRARQWLAKGFTSALAPEDAARMLAFIRLSGRATPRLMVCGSRAGLFAKVAAEHGSVSTCVDFSAAALKLHRRQFSEINTVCADVRTLPFTLSSFDGLWTDSLLSRIPRTEFEAVALELRRVLRPGGLLSARISIGDGEAKENSEHGQLLRSYWREENLRGALDLLDYGFSEAESLGVGRAVLTFRREY